MENMNKCPGCSQHCDRDNLQCGKGEAIFRGELTPESGHSHEGCGRNHHGQHEGHCHGHPEGKCCGRHEGAHKGHCEGKHHGHRRPEFPAGSVAALLAKCTHQLFQVGEETLVSPLTEEEIAQLKTLLAKIAPNG